MRIYFSRNPSESLINSICQAASNLRECIFQDFDILANIGNSGHNHYILSLTDVCLDIGKKIFKGNIWIHVLNYLTQNYKTDRHGQKRPQNKCLWRIWRGGRQFDYNRSSNILMWGPNSLLSRPI